MQRAIATYEKKYQIKLEHPVQVEVYPNHEDFAVRTLGMPGLGALGVTFGYAIAMDSPSGRKPGSFHWDSTLWHEMSHVFTLTMTNHRVPRWFTEGLAVHEETAASPEWGDRLGPDEITAIKEKKLLPVAELDRGFVHPVTPGQVVISYFQAGKICDYINEKWGWNTILAMLKDFGNNEDTPAVIRKELKIEPEEFDKQFLAHLDAETQNDSRPLRRMEEADEGRGRDVSQEGLGRRHQAGHRHPRLLSPTTSKSTASTRCWRRPTSRRAISPPPPPSLRRYVKEGGRNPDALKEAAKLLEGAGNKKEAAAVLDRLNYIYPMDNEAHQQLGSLWLDQGNAEGRDPRVLGRRGAPAARPGPRPLRSGAGVPSRPQRRQGAGRITGGPRDRSRVPAGPEIAAGTERGIWNSARDRQEIGMESACQQP